MSTSPQGYNSSNVGQTMPSAPSPTLITIFISGMLRYVYHFQMAGLLLFYLHTYLGIMKIIHL